MSLGRKRNKREVRSGEREERKIAEEQRGMGGKKRITDLLLRSFSTLFLFSLSLPLEANK